MRISNLAELKRTLVPGRKIKVIWHHRPEQIGLVKQVHTVQSNGVYLKVSDNPSHPVSVCNCGKGSWMGLMKASFYIFGDTVKLVTKPGDKNALLYEFEVLDEETAI